MITLQYVEREYGMRIPKKFKVMMGDKWMGFKAQGYLAKAMTYSLTSEDQKELHRIGSQGATEIPGLYYVCCIFIHPLTKFQALESKCIRLANSI